jgi:hypothetical protein
VAKNYSIPVPTRNIQAAIVEKAGIGARLVREISKRRADLTAIKSTLLQRMQVT